MHFPENLDDSTFEIIYQNHWKRLYRFALAKVHDRTVAEEIVQDLFVSLWEKRNQLKIINLQDYLMVAVRNRIIDYYKQRQYSDLETASQVMAPDYPLFLDDLEALLADTIEQMPVKTSEIFKLNRLDGKSADEIAKSLDIPKRTVEYHITQALRLLKSKFRHVVTALVTIFLSGNF